MFSPFYRNDCDNSRVCGIHQNSDVAQVVKSNLESHSSQNGNSGKNYEDLVQNSETVE